MFRTISRTKKLLALPFALMHKFPVHLVLPYKVLPLSNFHSPRYAFSSGSSDIPDLIKQGYDYLNVGKPAKAKSSFITALDSCLAHEPINHDQQCQALVGLSSVYTIEGETSKALKHLHEAEDAFHKTKDNDRAALSHLYYLLGRNYRQAEKYTDALKYAEEALKVHNEQPSEEDSKVGLIYYNIGVIQRSLKDLDKASSYFKRAVECFEKDKNVQIQELLFIYLELGYLLAEKQEYSEVVKYLERADEGMEKEISVAPSTRAELYFTLAQSYKSLQNNEKSETYFAKIVDLLKNLEVEKMGDAGLIANLLEVIGPEFLQAGKFQEAIQVMLKSLEIAKAKGNEVSAKVGVTKHLLGIAYGQTQDMENAIKYLEESVQIKSKTLGKDDMEVAMAQQNLGMTYLAVQKIKEAEEVLRKAYNNMKNGAGESHPMTVELKQLLDMVAKFPR